jgi:transposase-like protein
MQTDNVGVKGHTNKHAIAMSQGREPSGQRTEGTRATPQRRRWSDDERARIVAESRKPGARVSEVAKRHGVSRGMVFEWRRQAKAMRMLITCPRIETTGPRIFERLKARRSRTGRQ